jgi:hypothetical protein
MIQIDAPDKIALDAKFIEQLLSWSDTRGIDHVRLSLHEGAHLLYSRHCGFEPELYGPSDEKIYRHGLGWKRQLGAVECPPPEISLTADVVLVGKLFLGPAYMEEKLRGEEWKKEIWEQARGDLAHYNHWVGMRHYIVGDIHRTLSDEIRGSVYEDCSCPAFRQRLILAAREYESRVLDSTYGP